MADTNNDAHTLKTQCCIAGGGPAGIMLGFLLARNGIDVVVLEKWPDFFRDFRGDTIHPSTMELLNELELLDRFLALPHNETKRISGTVEGETFVIADFTKLKTTCPFLAFMPQWDFLTFLAEEGTKYPGFHLLMETEAEGLVYDNGRITGVTAVQKHERIHISADLIVGADGRHSTMREKAGLERIDLGVPIDVLWFRLPQENTGSADSLGYIKNGKMLVLIDRDTYWQCAFVIEKGGFEALKERGIEAFRTDIADAAPVLQNHVGEISGWDQIKLLSVSVDHLKRWHAPGFLCIGDAAHAMSPVGGVGINLAIQDAVAAAHILTPALKAGGAVPEQVLAAVQRRRAFPARVIQRMQVYLHTHVLARAIEGGGIARVPWPLRILALVPALTKLPAYLVGIGIRPEHIAQK